MIDDIVFEESMDIIFETDIILSGNILSISLDGSGYDVKPQEVSSVFIN